MSHLALKGNFNTSKLWAINWCRMSKGIFFISDIYNRHGTHLQKSATDTDTTFNIIHDFNSPRKHHTIIASRRTCKKEIITLCKESKDKLRTSLGQWRLDNNKYIPSWKWLLSRDIHTLYYREHVT